MESGMKPAIAAMRAPGPTDSDFLVVWLLRRHGLLGRLPPGRWTEHGVPFHNLSHRAGGTGIKHICQGGQSGLDLLYRTSSFLTKGSRQLQVGWEQKCPRPQFPSKGVCQRFHSRFRGRVCPKKEGQILLCRTYIDDPTLCLANQ